MYVRWKKRKSSDRHPDHQRWKANEITWSAQLVENKRIEGKPRQKVIAFIHSIKQSELASVTSRYYFWRYVITKKMRDYPFYTLSDEQKRKLFEALHKVVPLTEEEFTQEYERTRNVVGAWSMPSF